MEGQTFGIAELLKHKLILWAAASIIVIAAGSGVYYYLGTQKPQTVELPNGAMHAEGDITANGDVEPVENPDLSFESGGRVQSVSAVVGNHVFAGQVLASLDIGPLYGQRAAADANLKAAQARLDELKAGPRDTDKAVKENAVSQALQAQNASYASLPSSISDAYAKASDAVHLQTDSLFSIPNSTNPAILFTTTDSSLSNAAVQGRLNVGAELVVWSTELASLPASPSTADLDRALTRALTHLSVIRNFEDTVSATLTAATPSASFSTSQITAAQSSVSAARTSVNAQISTLTALQQALVSEGIAINSAKAALAQLVAGASPESIAAAQASVDAAAASVKTIDAQIAQNLIIARFPGTVASVSVKAGQLATPNVPAITILPDSALEVTVYVTEIDITRLTVGDVAEVTLDAYGANQVFPAHVSVIDQAPSPTQGVSAYKVTLSFDAPDARIKTGMGANATIHPGSGIKK